MLALASGKKPVACQRSGNATSAKKRQISGPTAAARASKWLGWLEMRSAGRAKAGKTSGWADNPFVCYNLKVCATGTFPQCHVPTNWQGNAASPSPGTLEDNLSWL